MTIEDLRNDKEWFRVCRHFGGAYLGLLGENWDEGKYGTFGSYLIIAPLVLGACVIADGLDSAERIFNGTVSAVDNFGQGLKNKS